MKILFDIKKLGAITNSKIEFKPFMIFSGYSSLGKSYTAFLTYYFINLFTSTRFKSIIEDNISIKNYQNNISNNEPIDFTMPIKDLQRGINYKAKQFIGYLIGYPEFDADINILFDSKDLDIKIHFDKQLDNYNNDLNPEQKIYIKIEDNIYTGPISYKNNIVDFIVSGLKSYFLHKLYHKENNFKSFFLPPSRASLVGTNVSEMNKIISSSGMYGEFLQNMELLTAASEDRFYPPKHIMQMLSNILEGTIKNEKGVLYYEFEDQKIPITAAASSIKEIAPLILLLNKFAPKDFSVLFEEPEAHVHPKMQVEIANIICQLVNEGAFFQVTTHSDYILNQINNLVRLHKIKKTDKKIFEEFCKQHNLNKNLSLDPKLLGAYYFQKRDDGTVAIITQNATDGIPFDTFEETIDHIMSSSSAIEEYLEED
ncbi:MAG: AAA family ATPase [Marinifilaceae bacterium]|jgi:hypothetical protein|nr:AAA family ATPase [Marinifilaceae bacterium]